MSETGQSGHPESSEKRTAAQWLLLCVSLAIVLGLVGYITYAHAVNGDAPPAIAVQPVADSLRQVGDRYLLDIQVRNAGDRLAEKVFIRVRANSSHLELPEEADVRIDFLPGQDQETHTVSFSKRPRPEAITYTAAFLKP